MFYIKSFVEELELVAAEEYKFEFWAKLSKIAFFWNFRVVKTLMQGKQINNSAIENFSTSGKFSIPTLIEKIKPVLLMKYQFE